MFKGIFSKNNIQTESAEAKPFGFWLGLFFGLIVLDQTSKALAVKYLGHIFLNDNFAFSLPLPPALMYLIYAMVLVWVFSYLKKSWTSISQNDKTALAFILAGGVSNIAERIIFGYVKDFIPVLNGIVNLADLYICFGLVILLIVGRRNFK